MRTTTGRAETKVVSLVALGALGEDGETGGGAGLSFAVSISVVLGFGDLTNNTIADRAAIAINVHAYFLLI